MTSPLTLGVPTHANPAELQRLMRQVLSRGRLTNGGPLVGQLEAMISHDLSRPWARATSSGTSALTVALLALDLPEGSEVVTTPLTFVATTLAIEAAGLRPRFAAVDSQTLTLDPDAVASAIGPRTSALLPVHFFGLPASPDLDEIGSRAGLPVVYDAAHAFGDGEPARALAARGSASCYSLHATKLLTTGEGGVVVGSDPDLASRVEAARNFGLRADGLPVGPGTNAKLPELSAALGLVTHARLAEEASARRLLRSQYDAVLAASGRVRAHGAPEHDALTFYAVRCDPQDQSDLLDALAGVGIVARAFPALCSPGARYANVSVVGGDARSVHRLASSVIALPFHSGVDAAAVARIGCAVR